MQNERPDGRARAGATAGIGDFAAKHDAQSRLHKCPRPHVLRFFLTPNELHALGKSFHHFPQAFFGEGIKLLDANDRCIVDLAVGPVIEQVVIDFTRAKNDPLSLIDRTRVRPAENFFKPSARKLFRALRL